MKKVIPPVLFIICTLVIIGLNILAPGSKILHPPVSYTGIVFIVIGLAITIRVRKLFDGLDTEIHTFKKPRRLIQNGLFKFSRNPIYLGFTISLFGVWIVTGNLMGFTGVLIFFLCSNFWYIPYEERIMEKAFGNDYEICESKGRRWI